MIIDHIGFAISDKSTSDTFYAKALAPLGIVKIAEVEGWVGYGRSGKPEFWFGEHEQPHNPMHIAFLADTRDQVDAFYAAALDAGGKDNGPPGIRAIYHPNYYGAFVIDPDGHNIEAVCHTAT
ncbi:VOC family protein [Thiosocius teredinicola]|uniref:VOC family protein n=1 Tax=Thiosocius teredinicola TaxID=1973002 RepID=UPI000990A567